MPGLWATCGRRQRVDVDGAVAGLQACDRLSRRMPGSRGRLAVHERSSADGLANRLHSASLRSIRALYCSTAKPSRSSSPDAAESHSGVTARVCNQRRPSSARKAA